MSTAANKALVARTYDEFINRENKAILDEDYAPDMIVHDPIMGTVNGVGAFKQLLGMFDAAFPGHRVTVHHMIAEGDWVSVVHTHTATHTGPLMGIPPTGKTIVVQGVELYRLANGKIVEFWRHDDDAGMLMQLGVLPPPGSAPA